MPAAQLPPDEDARLHALRQYRLIDTPPDAVLDDLVRQAKEVCGVPTALITLVDEKRQWFKSRIGLSLTETPRDQAFCAHALLTPDQPLIVPDAAADARFADNPLVTGDARIRFYAGVPLCSPEGQPLGTLCVLDQVPRELTDDQLDRLGALARQAAYELALRRRTPTERRLAQGFALTLILFVGILGFCFWQADNYLSSDWWLDHTSEVIRGTEGILSKVQTAESSQRGFSASGNEAFLVPYQEAVDTLPDRLAALQKAVDDNPAQVRRETELAALIEVKQAAMRVYIEDRRRLGLAALDPARATGRGRRTMSEVLAKGQEMVNVETLLARQRETDRALHLRVAAGALLGTGALCVALLTAGFVISRRELRRRQALGGSLAQANAGLRAEVAERRRAQSSLRESEARYQRIANNVPGMVYRFVRRADGGAAFSFVGEGCRRIFGLEPSRVLGDPQVLLDTVHPDDKEDFEHSLEVSAALMISWSWQGRIERPDTGETRSVEGNSQPERQPNGDIVWDGVLVDATGRRQADDNRRGKEEAERTNREKSRFLSRVSHELRTPLNAILGFGQLMELSTLEARDGESLAYMLKGARHLLSLVDEVLDLSCAETGELSLTPGHVKVDEVSRECVGLLSPTAQTRNVTCAVRATGSANVAWCDEQRLRQVLLNVLSNAIKYNREGGNVLVSCEHTPNNRLRISVSDTGVGIASERMQKLFVPFERLEHEDSKVAGTGLGLAVSRRLVEAMDGRLSADSVLGQGSTFRVELPLPEAPATEPPTPTNDPVFNTVNDSSPPAKLLYIEDNESNLQAVERLLGKLRPQWQILTAEDGRLGLELARLSAPDLILLDRHMPEFSGDEVLAELRRDADTESIPVIMLSADATAKSKADLLARGAVAYVSKPFRVDQLLAVIDRALSDRVTF